jgi:methyl-accepting chemotaxis protein
VARNLSAPAADAVLANDPLVYAQLVMDVIEDDHEPRQKRGFFEQAMRDVFAEKRVPRKNEGIYKAVIVNKKDDPAGVIASESGRSLSEVSGQKYQSPPFVNLGPDEPFPVFEDGQGDYAYDIRFPLVQDEKVIGDIHLYMRRDVITNTVRVATTRLVAIMLVSLLGGIIVLSLIVRVLMGPIKYLVQGVNAVAAGDFSKLVKKSPRDELGELVDAYNGMAKSLHEKEAVQEALA